MRHYLSATLLLASITLRAILRDRVLHMLFGASLLLLLLVPAFSLFSMRQVQELSITLSLSTLSFILLVSAILLGASSIWRDIEGRYTAAVLGLPISRSSYVLGKFLGIAAFLSLCSLFLGIISGVVIFFSASQYPAQQPIIWENLASAVFFNGCKYILLSAIALLLSAVSTSFFLPIFGSIAIFLAGSASQEVMEYLGGDTPLQVSAISKAVIKTLYYLIPNFTVFDLNVYAIYSLPLPLSGLASTFLYFLTYTIIILCLTAWSFARRELS
jgi:ABC-type transport system involved in multi-copper enzyme maturation permease subunit